MPHRDWIDLLEAFGPLIAVVVALIVGFTQLHLQRQQWDQSVYEMRHKVFRSVSNYWRVLIEKKGAPSIGDRQRFLAAISHARFLFGPDVVTFLEDYYAVTETYCETLRPSFFAKQNVDALSAAEAQEQLGLFAGLKRDEVFEPYLRIFKPPLRIRMKNALTRLKRPQLSRKPPP
jgi:hypothetical protein